MRSGEKSSYTILNAVTTPSTRAPAKHPASTTLSRESFPCCECPPPPPPPPGMGGYGGMPMGMGMMGAPPPVSHMPLLAYTTTTNYHQLPPTATNHVTPTRCREDHPRR
mmetsp:Transcript_102955/g.295222  ORF Transcript_102955/g.295222 Transcript_102955/m.295222 type:complete len:109 (-) Transcript_102955:11-337(-)